MTNNETPRIHSVVVTYRRQSLLERCLSAIKSQSLHLTKVVVVDNASNDGTLDWLHQWLPANIGAAQVVSLEENTGGAGGFAAGLTHAIDQGAEWVWMMDDDAEPHADALAELMAVAANPGNIYGSLAVAGNETAWETNLLDPPLGKIRYENAVPKQAEVEMLPLLGLLVHRDLVAKIGLPDAGFFIAGDDAEYCVRARRAGAKIIVAGRSRIDHPKSQARRIRVFGKEITYLSLPAWKRYYDTRNRLLIARKYHGVLFFTQTIPGSFLRLFAALLKEPGKLAQTHAFGAGFFDGLFGKKGKRHDKWGIKT